MTTYRPFRFVSGEMQTVKLDVDDLTTLRQCLRNLPPGQRIEYATRQDRTFMQGYYVASNADNIMISPTSRRIFCTISRHVDPIHNPQITPSQGDTYSLSDILFMQTLSTPRF